MKKNLGVILSSLVLIIVLSVSLVACDRGSESLTEQLEKKGYNVTKTDGKINDEQLSYIDTSKLEWCVYAEKGLEDFKKATDKYTQLKEHPVEIVFVLQFKDNDASGAALDAILANSNNRRYMLDETYDLHFTYFGIGNILYYGTRQGVKDADRLNEPGEANEEYLKDNGYTTQRTKEKRQLINEDRFPEINKNIVDWVVYGEKGEDFVYVFEFKTEEDAQQQFDVINGDPQNLQYKVSENKTVECQCTVNRWIVYYGTPQGLYDANMQNGVE